MKQCAFCLRPAKMTREHIWSAWIGRLFDDQEINFYAIGGVTPEDTAHWKSRSIDAKASVVCEQCNNGWMSDLDAEASITMSNMIRYGSGVSLLPLGIATVAAFAFKTAVVVDLASSKRPHPFFSHADRKRFATSLSIPRGVQIWLSLFHGKRLHGRYTRHYSTINTGHYKGFEVYIFTYVVGFLVVQLSAFRWGSIAKPPRFVPRLWQNDIWNPASIPLWPPAGKRVTWFALQYFDDQSIQAFSERWSHIAEWVRRN